MAKNLRIRCGTAGGINRPFDTRGNMVYTPAEAEEINRVDNRRHITGPEIEAVMGMVSAGNVMIACAPVLFDHASHCGKLPTLKRVVTMMRRLMVNLNQHLDIRQMNTIAGNLADAHIIVSANPVPPPGQHPAGGSAAHLQPGDGDVRHVLHLHPRAEQGLRAAAGVGAGAGRQAAGQGVRPEGRDTVPVPGDGDGCR